MQLAFGCVKFLQEELSLNRHEGASKHSGGSNAHKPFPETTLRLSPISLLSFASEAQQWDNKD